MLRQIKYVANLNLKNVIIKEKSLIPLHRMAVIHPQLTLYSRHHKRHIMSVGEVISDAMPNKADMECDKLRKLRNFPAIS